MAEPRDPDRSSPPVENESSSAPVDLEATQTFVNLAFQLQPGAVIGNRYRIIRMLGMGGMGKVYQAHDLELEQDVALKVIRPELLQDDDATERFKREILLARKVSHRNVVRIHDIGEYEGLKYLSMSFIEGKSLRELLRTSGTIEPQLAEALFRQICEAVAAAHEEGVIHRDLKPANILLDQQDRPFITDFGIARSHEVSEMTMTGVLVGTPAYISPEQLQGDPATAQSDVYALGIILFEMLTGELPPRDPRKTAKRLRESQPKIPGKLGIVVQRCLAPDPRQRFADADAILQALDGAPSALRLPSLGLGDSRSGWLWGVGVVALLAALFALWLAWPLLQTGPASGGPERSVVVLPLENQTQNPQLDWMQTAAADLLIADLSQSRHLRVVSGERTFQTLTDLKIDDYALDRAELKRLASIFDADILLQGTLTQAGQTLRLDLQLIDILRQDSPEYLKASGSTDAFLALVSNLADQARRQLRVQPQLEGPARVFTASMSSLEDFQQGAARFRSGDYPAAADFLERSIQADARFMGAYLLLSRSYEFAGDQAKARAVLERAQAITDSNDPHGSQIVKARLALMDGQVDRSVQLFEQLSKAYPNDSDLFFETALAFEEAGQLEKAVASLREVVRLDPTHPRAFFHLGKDTILLGESEKALGEYLVKGLAISTQLEDLYGKADVLNAMGVAYERLGRYEEAIQHYRQSYDLKQQVDNKLGAATSLSNVANIMIYQGRYEEAEEILKRTLALFQEIDNPRGVANAYNQFGVIYEDRGEFKRALDFYKEGLQIRKRLGLDLKTAQSYDNIGYIYYLTGEYDNAEVYWRQSLELKQSLGDERGVIISHQNMGFLQTAQGDVNTATKSFLEALERSRAIKLENGTAVSLGNLAYLYQMQGRYRAALESYREAKQILRQLDDKRGLAEYTKLLGSALIEMSAFDEAGQELDQSLQLAREIGSAELEADVLTLLGNLQRLQDQLKQAGQSLDQALNILKGKPELQKTLVRAKVEQALLLSDLRQPARAAAMISSVKVEARRIGNVWLEMLADYAGAQIDLRRKEYRSALTTAETNISRASKMGLKPYLLRLQSMAGEASLGLGRDQQARSHFESGAEQLQEITRLTDERYVAGLHAIPEVKTIENQLNALKPGGEAS